MNSAEKLEMETKTPGNQELPKSPEENTSLNYKERFKQFIGGIYNKIKNGATVIKEDSDKKLNRMAHSYDLPEDEFSALRKQGKVDENLELNSRVIDELAKDTKEKIKNIEKERTMEGFQQERGTILRDLLSFETMNSGINLVPFAGGGKMLVEAIAGKELTGNELTGKERVIHGAIGAGSLALDFTGIGEAGKVGVIAGKSIGLIEKIGARLSAKGAVRSARIFEKTAEFMVKNPELTAKAEIYADTKIKSLITKIKDYQKDNRPTKESPAEAVA
jgi:hypothetical protein